MQVFFFHLWKTGGTSVVATFWHAPGIKIRNLGEIQSKPCDLPPHVTEDFVFSHISPLALNTPPATFRTMLLREPTKRTISHFCFAYKNRYTLPGEYEFFKTLGKIRGPFDADDILRWLEHGTRDNLQCRFLAENLDSKISNADVTKALIAINSCHLVGITEDLGAYLALVSKLSGLEISIPIRANITDRSIISSTNEEISDRISQHIEVDQSLYLEAKAKFASVLDRFPKALQSPLVCPPRHSPLRGLGGLMLGMPADSKLKWVTQVCRAKCKIAVQLRIKKMV